MEYNATTIWLSRIVEWGQQYVNNALLAALLTIGWIPLALTIVAVDPATASTPFLIGQLVACLGVVVAPFDVWYYDERLLPQFFADVDELVADHEMAELHEFADRYDTYYSRFWWASTLPWLVMVMAVFGLGLGYFRSQGITTLIEQAAYLGFFLYWLVIAGLRSHAVIVTLLAIRTFIKRVELDIDPLHPDGLGGLSKVGSLAIQTTVIISTGSFALPLAFQLASHLRFRAVVYAGVGLFVLLVAFNFFYPTYIVNRRAQTLREEKLEELRKRIRELESRVSIPEQADNAEATARNDDLIQMEIRRARRDYEDYKNVTLYPLSIGIIVRLATSLLLPIAFTVFEVFVSQVL